MPADEFQKAIMQQCVDVFSNIFSVVSIID